MEEWKEIEDTGYLISSEGNVRRKVPVWRKNPDGKIKLCRDSRGYLIFSASVHNIKKTVTVHKEVMKAFVGPSNGLDINHKDGNKTNNCLSNLEYVTSHENCIHASKNGLLATGDRNGRRLHPESIPRGDNHWTKRIPERKATGDRHGSHTKPEKWKRGTSSNLSKLKEEDVIAIRKRFAEGERKSVLAKAYGVTYSNIKLIVERKSWKHLMQTS